MAAGVGVERPLKELADAFHDLGQTVGPSSPPLTFEALLGACSKILPLIATLLDHTSYVFEALAIEIDQMHNNALNGATTLADLIDEDKVNNCVRIFHSNCFIILRLRRSLELIKVMSHELLNGRDITLETAAENAYTSVFAEYHLPLTQTLVIATMSELRTKQDEETTQLKRYIDGSTVVIDYVDNLFKSKEVSTDW